MRGVCYSALSGLLLRWSPTGTAVRLELDPLCCGEASEVLIQVSNLWSINQSMDNASFARGAFIFLRPFVAPPRLLQLVYVGLAGLVCGRE